MDHVRRNGWSNSRVLRSDSHNPERTMHEERTKRRNDEEVREEFLSDDPAW